MSAATDIEQVPAWFGTFERALYQRLGRIEGSLGGLHTKVNTVDLKVTETNGGVRRAHERIDEVKDDLEHIEQSGIEERRHIDIKRVALISAGVTFVGAIGGGLVQAVLSATGH